MKKFLLFTFLIFVASASFAQGIIANQQFKNNTNSQIVASSVDKENSCNIIFSKMNSYNCQGYLDRASVYINPNDNQNLVCLRLFEIYVINDCDNKARIIKPKEIEDKLGQDEVTENVVEESPNSPEDGTVCGKEKFASLIGKDKSEIKVEDLQGPYRILCHSCMATMDFSPARINFHLDENDKVKSISCG